MQDPTVPAPGDQGPSAPAPTAKQDYAVLAWLALEPNLPVAVQRHLMDALDAWEPLMGPYLFPTEPQAGVDCDLNLVIQEMWLRRHEQAIDAPWADKVALNEVCGRLGLAFVELRRPARPTAW